MHRWLDVSRGRYFVFQMVERNGSDDVYRNMFVVDEKGFR